MIPQYVTVVFNKFKEARLNEFTFIWEYTGRRAGGVCQCVVYTVALGVDMPVGSVFVV